MRTSSIYFFLALIVAAGAVGYGVFQFRIYQAEVQAISDMSGRIASLGEEQEKLGKELKEVAQAHAAKQEEAAKKLASILPPDENYTELTREWDRYFEEHDRSGNPIFQSSLRFGKGVPKGDAAGIFTLPVSMNLEATRDNFFKFLDYVQKSGTLLSGNRLMEVNSIQLNFPEGGEVVKDLKQEINFTVDMNAYYKAAKVAR